MPSRLRKVSGGLQGSGTRESSGLVTFGILTNSATPADPVRVTRRRPGFTLVEMLVVVAIIGILLTLVTVAGYQALKTVRERAIVIEVNQLEAGITAYKSKFGDIPPDTITSDTTKYPTQVPAMQAVVKRHLQKLFPRNREGIDPFASGTNPANGKPFALFGKELDNSETLVYFLSGMYDNPEFPLSGPGQVKVFYEFPVARLVDHDLDGFPSFVPAYGTEGGDGKRAPYLYFEPRTYGVSLFDRYPPYNPSNPSDPTDFEIVRAYCTSNTPPVWESRTTFQIVSAGLDGHFGDRPTGSPPPFKEYPSGGYYDLINPGDRDNVTSFAEGALEDKLP